MGNAMFLELIASKILFMRGQRVMLDKDLAKLYGISVKALNQAVSRNLKRFPCDFMYQITKQEVRFLRSQIVTLKAQLYVSQGDVKSEPQILPSKRGQHIKYLPYVFTEQGVAMLSSVLNSQRAIHVNISIMRAFVKLRELLLTHKDLADKISELEKKYANHDDKIQLIFEAIRKLLEPVSASDAEPMKQPIGFHRD